MVRREDMVSPEGNMKGKVRFLTAACAAFIACKVVLTTGAPASVSSTTRTSCPSGEIGNNIANYEVTGLTGTNTSRVIQLVSRINW